MEGYLKLEDKLKHLPFLKESQSMPFIRKGDSNSPNTVLPVPPKIIVTQNVANHFTIEPNRYHTGKKIFKHKN